MKWLFFIFLAPRLAQAAIEPVVIRTLTEVTGGGLSVSGSSVTVLGEYAVLNSTIAVSSGSGFSVFESSGQIADCAIIPVVSSATYSFEIVTNDGDEFPVGGKDGLTGKTSLAIRRYFVGSHRIGISNASSNGNYRARCVILK